MEFKGPVEVALSNDQRGEPYNFSLWDIHTGAQLIVFKGIKSSPVPKCLYRVDENYFITAHDNLLHIWSIFNRKSQDQKLFLPSRPSSLCISPCAKYLIVGINEMIYVWHFTSGNLVAHAQRHYQSVIALKMNRLGTFLFSAAEDGMVLCWPFADLISGTHHTGSLNQPDTKKDIGVNEPRFTWQHHSGPVTDLHITNSGLCMTVGIDQILNVYSIANGKRLYTIMMPTPLYSVVVDKNETSIYLGGKDGKIYEILVSTLSLSMLNARKGEEEEKRPVFVGHLDKIVSLKISMDSTRLISASSDSTCKIWDIRQKKLLRDIKHLAPLANLETIILPDAFSMTTISNVHSKRTLACRPLKRCAFKMPNATTLSENDLFEESSTVVIPIRNTTNEWESSNLESTPGLNKIDESLSDRRRQVAASVHVNNDNPGDSQSNEQTIKRLKRKIHELYMFSSEKIFKDAANNSYLSSYKDYGVDPES